METLGRRIKRLRQACDLSAAELARRAGTSRTTISELETGKRQGSDPALLARLAAELGITLDELVLGEGAVAPEDRAPALTPEQRAEVARLLDALDRFAEDWHRQRDALRRLIGGPPEGPPPPRDRR